MRSVDCSLEHRESGRRRPDEASAVAVEETDARGGLADPDPTQAVGQNLRRLRLKRGLSLERLARASGVSRAMIGQIELRQSVPTIHVLWKIVRALDVPLTALISGDGVRRTWIVPAARAMVVRSERANLSARALLPIGERRPVEFYEMRLAPQSAENLGPRPAGTVGNLVVTSGVLEIVSGADRYLLSTGDAIQFAADLPHEYRNPGDAEVVMYLVMTFVEPRE